MATSLVIGDALKIKMKKMKKIRKQKDMNIKIKKIEGVFYHWDQKGHMSNDFWVQKNGHYKKFEKEEKAINGNEDDLVLCLLMSESKIEIKKILFVEDVK